MAFSKINSDLLNKRMMESYGFSRIAVWPDSNSDGPNGSYLFLDPTSIAPADATWYALQQSFLTYWNK